MENKKVNRSSWKNINMGHCWASYSKKILLIKNYVISISLIKDFIDEGAYNCNCFKIKEKLKEFFILQEKKVKNIL
jgi:hypothetical protein